MSLVWRAVLMSDAFGHAAGRKIVPGPAPETWPDPDAVHASFVRFDDGTVVVVTSAFGNSGYDGETTYAEDPLFWIGTPTGGTG